MNSKPCLPMRGSRISVVLLLMVCTLGVLGEVPDFDAMNPGFLGFGFSYFAEGHDTERRGWLQVRGVVQGSPAEEAGLKAQDVIVEMDQMPFKENRYSEVLERFAKVRPGQSVTLTVRRGTATLTLSLTAAPTSPEQLERWRLNFLMAYEREAQGAECCAPQP